jgi:DNA/RNA-binding domain of Phe-tRNA-synthetase-like protein
VLAVEGITSDVDVRSRVDELMAFAERRLGENTEGDLPEIQAWRRAFSKMGLKPTQYRCASEALLRRLRKEGSLPQIHPLVDLCNAVSAAFAIPVAALDVAGIAEYVEVRYATGSETYLAFSGEIERPEPGEVVFADAAGRAHARRWTNRQSAASAVRDETAAALIVAEALHATAGTDVERLVAELADAIRRAWSTAVATQILGAGSPRFEL